MIVESSVPPASDASHAPVWFSAAFSIDSSLIVPARDLTSKLAVSLGYPAAEVREISEMVSGAMSRAMDGATPGAADPVELTFRIEGDRLEAMVIRGQEPYGHLSKPLPPKPPEA